jgi:hypothetical protein
VGEELLRAKPRRLQRSAPDGAQDTVSARDALTSREVCLALGAAVLNVATNASTPDPQLHPATHQALLPLVRALSAMRRPCRNALAQSASTGPQLLHHLRALHASLLHAQSVADRQRASAATPLPSSVQGAVDAFIDDAADADAARDIAALSFLIESIHSASV